jgi:hypothetical protein
MHLTKFRKNNRLTKGAPAIAMLQDESVDMATVSLTAKPFLFPCRATADLVALADDVAMAEAYVVGMVAP